MSRTWFAVTCKTVRLPKFRNLTDTAQLTLIYVWAIAGDEDPEATWTDADELAGSLALYGRPRDSLDELIAGGWLDVADNGEVSVRDWDLNQFAASKAARNAWEAKYMRGWRAEQKRKAAEPPSPDNPIPDRTLTAIPIPNRSRQRVNNRTSKYLEDSDEDVRAAFETGEERNSPIEEEGWGSVWTEFLKAWYERFRLPPKGAMDEEKSQRGTLYPIVSSFPTLSANWCRSAPAGANSHAVVGHVIDEYRRMTRAA